MKLKTSSFVPAISAIAALSCGHQGQSGPRPDQIPRSVSVPSSSLTAGYAIGKLKASISVDGFRITAEPVRLRDYAQCVDAGVCTKQSLDTDQCKHQNRTANPSAPGTPSNGDFPETCATPNQAIQYCTWQKGSLPDENQWLLAARGPSIHRWPWGDTAPSCQQHPLSQASDISEAGCARGQYDPLKVFATGLHKAGTARSGAADILLTNGELLRAAPSTISSTCAGRDPGVCLVVSLSPGAIDAARSITLQPSPSSMSSLPTYSFRCVWTDS
jgi:hypothetical protein